MRMFKGRRLRFDILTAFSALICVTVACEILYSTHASKSLILEFEERTYSNKVASLASDWLDSYFKQVELAINVLSRNSVTVNENGDIGLVDFEDLFKEALIKTPFTLSFYVALNDGNYLQVRNTRGLKSMQNNPEEKIPEYVKYAVRTIDKRQNEAVEVWTYLNEDFSPVLTETLNQQRYNPQKRAWYVDAELNRGVTWTDAYIFSTSKLPGITISSPISKQGGKETYGVVAVDFALSDFQELLEKIKPTKNSDVYLLNKENEIICTTKGIDQYLQKVDGEIKLTKSGLSGDSMLIESMKSIMGTGERQGDEKMGHGTFEHAGEKYSTCGVFLSKVPFLIITITPETDLTGSFNQVQRNMLVISILIFLLSCSIVAYLSRKISDPIVRLCESAKAIGNMDMQNYPTPPDSDIYEISQLSSAMNAMKLSISTFSKYAPKDLVRKLLQSGSTAQIGGITKDVTMLFSDIQKFSTISERLPAEYLVLHLSEYFDELTKNIMAHQGTIDKYIGDAIMAIWGAPNSDEDQVIHACEAALDCQKILENLKQRWIPLGKPALPTRIGLHKGPAIVGNIGSQDRMNFTAIGDSVNIASRLEGANKVYGTWILASETVEKEARGKILFRVIDRIAVKGRSGGVTVYEPICATKNADEMYYKVIELCSKSKEAFELYQSEKFSEAIKIYEEILKAFPEKESSILPLLTRCKQFAENPPMDWDGINYLTSK